MELTRDEESEMCPVCLEPFNDPRFLPCHHTLCTACIQDVASRHQGKSFPCPSCRKHAALPRKGVQAFQTNYYIKPRPKLSDAQTSTSSYAMCKVHEERLKYHCMDCKESVCSDCRLTTHKDHKARSIHEVISDKKDDNVKMAEKQTEMVMVKQFKCSDERNTRVFWLYHTLGHLHVSFEQCGREKNVPIKEFRDDGEYLGGLDRCMRYEVITGIVSFKNSPVRYVVLWAHYESGTMSKHKDYELRYTPGKPCVINHCTVAVSFWPPKIQTQTKEFTINVGHCRAFDVDSSKTVFVVVEEAKVHHNARKVVMYRRPGGNAICTYSPPNSAHFKPVDICFFTLNGEEVLLVADEAANNLASIHVVKVGQTSLTFERFLVTDCPVLRQPTALNFDVNDRLWVACKRGNIVALKEKCVNKAVSDPAPLNAVKQRSAKVGNKFWLQELGFFVFSLLCLALYGGMVYHSWPPLRN